MSTHEQIGDSLIRAGISRRAFLKYCASIASLFALPASAVRGLAAGIQSARRVPVIWLSCQECTGCTESLARSSAPTLEQLLFNLISLDYHHTLMAAAGAAAEAARTRTLETQAGRYLLIVDGSVPTGPGYSTIAGVNNLAILDACVSNAAAVIAVGSCAAFGGLPAAHPNPTGAMGVASLMRGNLVPSRPLVNLPGCPPIPAVIGGLLTHYVAFARFPDLDELARPLAFYANTVHQRCSRYYFYKKNKFAERFDDEGARKGWCLYKLGCKGPTTHNACATLKWNDGTGSPIDAGHPCIGCSEPGFWDKGDFYRSLALADASTPIGNASSADGIDAGKAVYRDNCLTCHNPDPRTLSTPPDAVAELLRSQRLRSHRKLNLSDIELGNLEAYLQAVRKGTAN
jgi:hydrogenase small subunit